MFPFASRLALPAPIFLCLAFVHQPLRLKCGECSDSQIINSAVGVDKSFGRDLLTDMDGKQRMQG